MDKNATNRIKNSLISGKTISKIRLYVCLNYIRHDMDICEKRFKKNNSKPKNSDTDKSK